MIVTDNTCENGSALIFASEIQPELLQSAASVYFDSTFEVVSRIYYQLLTLIIHHADSVCPVYML